MPKQQAYQVYCPHCDAPLKVKLIIWGWLFKAYEVVLCRLT